MQGTLGIDANLQNKLHALVERIHTSLNPHSFKDPLDSTCFFHVQCEEPVRTRSEALPPIPYQQEELNAASSILKNLNPANSIPSALQTWDQPTVPKPHSQQLPLHIDDDNWTLSYIDKPGNPANEPIPHNGPPQNRPPHFNLHAPHTNMPPPCQNVPAPPRQPTGPRAPQPSFPTNPPCSLSVPIPNPPTNANYFGPPTPGGPPPP
ncbi:hypothetical protein E4T56_gene20639 [Termitomyces sp. T112]|nr:hypothetical protein E4T56_gene20639 [Termitomyces sp. T112]